MEWKTFGNVYLPPDANRRSAARLQLYAQGKKHYGKKAKLVISPFVSIAGKSVEEVSKKIDFCIKLGLFENRHLISTDISVEKYDNPNIWSNIINFYDNKIVIQDNYISGLHTPDYAKPYIDEDYKITNWYHTEAVWCGGSSPQTTHSHISISMLFYELINNEMMHNDFDIARIRVTFNKIIEK